MLHRNLIQLIKEHPVITVFMLIIITLIVLAWWLAGLQMQNIDQNLQKL